MSSEFNAEDLKDLKARGISPETASGQLQRLRRPAGHRELDRPCVAGDGVVKLEQADFERVHARGLIAARQGRVTRFVPASGAASRMFKALAPLRGEVGLALEGVKDPLAREFFERLGDFPFAAKLARALGVEESGLAARAGQGDLEKVVRALLDGEGLGYAGAPKALIDFHRYPEGPRCALAEHMAAAGDALLDMANTVRLHFTVSPEHREAMAAEAERVAAAMAGTRFELGWSEQKPSTDTLALNGDGGAFRQDDGSLLFRPGGHGALLENLNDLAGDLVQVKNIDNIAPARLHRENARWKLALAGLAVELKDQVLRDLKALKAAPGDPVSLAAARSLLREAFFLDAPEDPKALIGLLDRPLRVCGVVRNEGEPGGGPFWVKGPDGRVSAQIVESAEMNLEDPGQREIQAEAAYFNPVDLVLSLRDTEGKPYDLLKYRDPEAVFIADKSHQGRPLKALELPGLWNGAMADWLTVFVEVPLTTFNPVKTVNDLLRDSHRA